MKAMTKNQKICIIIMITFMILADILVVINNNTAKVLAYVCIIIVVIIGIYFYILGLKDRNDYSEEHIKNQDKNILKRTKNK